MKTNNALLGFGQGLNQDNLSSSARTATLIRENRERLALANERQKLAREQFDLNKQNTELLLREMQTKVDSMERNYAAQVFATNFVDGSWNNINYYLNNNKHLKELANNLGWNSFEDTKNYSDDYLKQLGLGDDVIHNKGDYVVITNRDGSKQLVNKNDVVATFGLSKYVSQEQIDRLKQQQARNVEEAQALLTQQQKKYIEENGYKLNPFEQQQYSYVMEETAKPTKDLSQQQQELEIRQRNAEIAAINATKQNLKSIRPHLPNSAGYFKPEQIADLDNLFQQNQKAATNRLTQIVSQSWADTQKEYTKFLAAQTPATLNDPKVKAQIQAYNTKINSLSADLDGLLSILPDNDKSYSKAVEAMGKNLPQTQQDVKRVLDELTTANPEAQGWLNKIYAAIGDSDVLTYLIGNDTTQAATTLRILHQAVLNNTLVENSGLAQTVSEMLRTMAQVKDPSLDKFSYVTGLKSLLDKYKAKMDKAIAIGGEHNRPILEYAYRTSIGEIDSVIKQAENLRNSLSPQRKAQNLSTDTKTQNANLSTNVNPLPPKTFEEMNKIANGADK